MIYSFPMAGSSVG